MAESPTRVSMLIEAAKKCAKEGAEPANDEWDSDDDGDEGDDVQAGDRICNTVVL